MDFSYQDHGWKVSDCTAEGLKCCLLSTLPPLLVGEQLEPERLYDVVNVILSLQSPNGGVSAWDPAGPPKWLENGHFPFIYCIESLLYKHKYSQWESCYEKLGLDSKPIAECGLGKELELQYVAETSALQPPHQYVPWVVVDGLPLYEVGTETYIW